MVSLILTYLGYISLGFVLMLLAASILETPPQPPPDSEGYAETGEAFPAPAEEDIDLTVYRVWSSLLAFALYAASVYNIGWRYGLRDRNVVKCGYAPQNDWRGLIAGSYAQAPPTVMLLAFWICLLLGVSIRPWFELSHSIYGWLFDLPDALYVLFLPVTPLLVHFGFRNGFKDISLRRKLIYIDPQKERKRKKGMKFR
ncbi:MAG: hypothetical protein FWG93_03585 [Oscillospiraceae bacterium]|nr:hypothetical protein [Oscillospiraceae bacterium]